MPNKTKKKGLAKSQGQAAHPLPRAPRGRRNLSMVSRTVVSFPWATIVPAVLVAVQRAEVTPPWVSVLKGTSDGALGECD
jgi:hypothetical protein